MYQKDARGSGRKVGKPPQPIIWGPTCGQSPQIMDEVQAGEPQRRAAGSASGTKGP